MFREIHFVTGGIKYEAKYLARFYGFTKDAVFCHT
jgi:hypothetical protein